ncbi:hypothetical protein [Paracoccus sp. (in: a-proteobacteria)]|uniref:hypothetical protein n=1 Tax=Paracoccus sp. TaxID=267 RepID=UPI002897C12E|nr:hypothetical protein [Paracoccus sp. (in: a-proteobacteria)]
MVDGFDDDMTRCPCCDGEGYFYHGDEPKSPWGDAATIARLTAELTQARAEAVAAYESAVWQVRSSVPGHMLVGDTERICDAIRALATEPGTTALAEIIRRAAAAETRACAEVAANWWMNPQCERPDIAILARIDQRKGAGE